MHDVAAHLKSFADSCDTEDAKAVFLKDCEPLVGQDAEVCISRPQPLSM